MPLFQCDAEDFEGDLVGAMRHASDTGHSLTRTDNFGNTMKVSLEPWEDDDAED